MTPSDFSDQLKAMSAEQDSAAALVLPVVGKNLASQIKLCGGTALSRFYLRHRISYDLDFFVPEGIGFNAQDLANRIAKDVPIVGLEVTHDAIKADQLHFFVPLPGGGGVKMSFVEDMYAATFPPVRSGLTIAGIDVNTESVEGLYHRKIRTVVGWADSGSTTPSGGRQTARDMFDLFVLSQAVMPLKHFISSLPYAFPLEAFVSGMAAMPWYELTDELSETIAAPAWAKGKDVEALRDHLFSAIGMVELPPELGEDEEEINGSVSRSTKRRKP